MSCAKCSNLKIDITITIETKIGFGFYSFVIILTVSVISVLRLLYFTQDIIVEKLPILEIYIDYLFESIRNIKEIIQNFFSNY